MDIFTKTILLFWHPLISILPISIAMQIRVSYHVTESSHGRVLIPPAVRYAPPQDVKYVKLCRQLPKRSAAPGYWDDICQTFHLTNSILMIFLSFGQNDYKVYLTQLLKYISERCWCLKLTLVELLRAIWWVAFLHDLRVDDVPWNTKRINWVCIWTKPTFYNANNNVRDKPSFSSNLRRFRHDLLRDTSVVFLDAASYRASLGFVLIGINNIQQNKNWFDRNDRIIYLRYGKWSLTSGMARNENQELTSGMVIRELQMLLKPPWKATL